MLNISENSVIYISCLAHCQTGGTEALHMLAYELRKLGKNAVMVYFGLDKNTQLRVCENFIRYNIPYSQTLQDEPQNIFIIPESTPQFLYATKKVQKVFWWLSVDNYFVCAKDAQVDFNDSSVLHLAQSYYAYNFLEQKNIQRKAFCGDYLREDFLMSDYTKFIDTKENLIVFNPVKGYEFTRHILQRCKDLCFVPIARLFPHNVKSLLKKSKIYIDFGNHPGKDRIPREAAILGNIVITGRRGSANYHEDIPIDTKYKFADNECNYDNLASFLYECMCTYRDRIEDFEIYRTMIRNDRANFIQQVESIFCGNVSSHGVAL